MGLVVKYGVVLVCLFFLRLLELKSGEQIKREKFTLKDPFTGHCNRLSSSIVELAV
jgi:hypothetical protein